MVEAAGRGAKAGSLGVADRNVPAALLRETITAA
jgi:hypothetical protein